MEDHQFVNIQYLNTKTPLLILQKLARLTTFASRNPPTLLCTCQYPLERTRPRPRLSIATNCPGTSSWPYNLNPFESSLASILYTQKVLHFTTSPYHPQPDQLVHLQAHCCLPNAPSRLYIPARLAVPLGAGFQGRALRPGLVGRLEWLMCVC